MKFTTRTSIIFILSVVICITFVVTIAISSRDVSELKIVVPERLEVEIKKHIIESEDSERDNIE